jgi:hypothetical protein
MINLKKSLREEIYLYSNKKLLSEDSLLLIKNDYYTKTVLGLDKSLYENDLFTYKKLIIEQQIIIENLLNSINNFLGSAVQKGKEKSLQLINSLGTLKELAILFKNMLLDPKLMEESIENTKTYLNEEINKLKSIITNIFEKISVNVEGFTSKLDSFFKNTLKIGDEILKKNGWVGFIMILGLSVLLTWLRKNWLEKIANILLDNIKGQIQNLDSIIEIFNKLKNLGEAAASNTGIDTVLKWFIEFASGANLIGIVFTASSIIEIISKILFPVVVKLKNNFNLSKNESKKIIVKKILREGLYD